ncbi:MAG: hypothetical protein AAGA30_15425 [Planctomycetota bacterium]
MKTSTIRKRVPKKPIGILLGLLAGTLATIVGVVCGVDPFTILCRSVLSGIAVGVTVAIGVGFVRLANRPNEARQS